MRRPACGTTIFLFENGLWTRKSGPRSNITYIPAVPQEWFRWQSPSFVDNAHGTGPVSSLLWNMELIITPLPVLVVLAPILRPYDRVKKAGPLDGVDGGPRLILL